jgi:outer membrane protein assembly factor BamE (lipoprotein component of BamABCDE complex)
MSTSIKASALPFHRPHSFGRKGLRRPALYGLLLVAGLAIAGCTNRVDVHGHMPKPEALAEIKPQTTTREQVRDLLGSPTAVATFDDKRWYYISQKTENGPFSSQELIDQEILIVTFNDTGVVDKIDRRTGMEANQEIDLVDRETPTKGRELTFLDQLLGNLTGNRISKTSSSGPGTVLGRRN